MSPKELSLSQRVLEFLIIHQDCFVIDIPRPPTHPRSPLRAFSEIDVTADSEDEQSGVGGSWKLVHTGRPQIPRRPTTLDSSGMSYSHFLGFFFVEHTDILLGSHNSLTEARPFLGGLKRSRTLPSHRKGTGHEGEERARVLRKHKRASAIPPSHGGAPPEKPNS